MYTCTHKTLQTVDFTDIQDDLRLWRRFQFLRVQVSKIRTKSKSAIGKVAYTIKAQSDFLSGWPMTETTDNNHHRTFGEKWKITRFFRKNGPSFLAVLSVYFVGMAILWSFIGTFDRAIFCLLLAGMMLGYSAVIPLLAKHKNSESRVQNS